MNRERIIENTASFVRKKLKNDSSGHDWWHIYRVWKLSKVLGKKEGADLFVVELAALLHDIEDWKFSRNKKTDSKIARNWLASLDVEPKDIGQVCAIIDKISYKGAGVPDRMPTIEGKVVQDADRLDALGAIGIARAFAYGGSRNRIMHDPKIRPVLHGSFKSYKKNKGTTINHFYEKLLLLKDRMNTKSGKKLAIQRHRFMAHYLDEFYKEWKGIRL